MWSGLTALALDVFSAPATSVDVERLFSKAGRHVTPLRHRLKAVKLGQMVTLGGWFREGWVPTDCLGTYLNDERDKKLMEKAKGKKRAEVEDPVDEQGDKTKRRRIAGDADDEDDA
ncbi:unnamed protein product [Tilletia controversa]|uniref:HAT C-terminal dimerisation domain-containing protein n=1 Tax=Tilletia controversa TaxID=13291 RepID=A0A8X7SRX0_9BASI|nr:hypothetical protein A4X06_0g9854 [Tilletia controversa]CAD6958427.1 unnamed protein product [Tilletia controversa]